MFNNVLAALIYIFCWTYSAIAQIQFFDGQIQYWGNGEESKNRSDKLEASHKRFDWKPYHDPSKDSFFREGSYQPPKPFIELVRNPSDENIRNWFRYIELKNHLSDRLVQRLKEYSEMQAPKVSKALKFVAQETKMETYNRDSNRFRIRYYFDPKCPYCKKMFEAMESLQQMGFYIEAHQVTGDESRIETSLIVNKATKDELDQHQIRAVPFLLIGDLQSKRVFRLSGYRNLNEVLKSIEEVKKKK